MSSSLNTAAALLCLLQAAPETASGSADDAAAEPAAESPGTVLEDGSIMFKF